MTSSHSPPPVTLTRHRKQCSVRPLACDCQAVKFEIASRMMRETLRSHGRPLSRQATPTLTLFPRPSPKPNPKPKPNLCPSPSASASASPSPSPSARPRPRPRPRPSARPRPYQVQQSPSRSFAEFGLPSLPPLLEELVGPTLQARHLPPATHDAPITSCDLPPTAYY